MTYIFVCHHMGLIVLLWKGKYILEYLFYGHICYDKKWLLQIK